MNNKIGLAHQYLDLRGTPCPVNFIRCRLAIEKMNSSQLLQVDLDKGEPEKMVIPGLKKIGCNVEIILEECDWIRLMVSNSER